MTDSVSNHRIARNTLMLYTRMILLLVISLYTSRVVLQVLGIEDYGVYNVVGGFVSIFTFLNSAMSGATMRYITFSLGRDDKSRLRDVFATSLLIHLAIALLILLLAETLGLWFVCNKMVIPPGQEFAAHVVYQCSVITTVVGIVNCPYNADIIAHEKMSAFAYISIYEAVAKLMIVFLLLILPGSKLIQYAVFILVVQLSVRYIYTRYCNRNFEETRFRFVYSKSLIKEMLSFTGWNLWGNLAGALYSQGINVLLNVFFGPAVNAARGIAVQIQAVILQFSSNFQAAINPQIIKSYASGQLVEMYQLIYRSSKFSFLLLIILVLPLSMEINWALAVWLGKVPAYTAIFVLIILSTTVIDSVSNPLMISASATGKIKRYQSIIGGLLLLIVPIAYVALRMGYPPYSVFVVHLLIALVAFICRLVIVRQMIGLPLKKYAGSVLLPCFYVGISVYLLLQGVKSLTAGAGIPTVVIMIAGFCIAVVIAFCLGLTIGERRFVMEKLSRILRVS